MKLAGFGAHYCDFSFLVWGGDKYCSKRPKRIAIAIVNGNCHTGPIDAHNPEPPPPNWIYIHYLI
jgi:hypothetical protein